MSNFKQSLLSIDNWKKVCINWDAIEMARHWTEITEIAMGKTIE